jgi:uncharacterized membrane protein
MPMDSPAVLMLLRIIHIVGGVIWVGGVVAIAGFILPAARAVGPAAGPVMNQLVRVRKLPLYMLITGWLTVIAGFILYGRLGMLAGPAWFATPAAQVFGVGGVLGLVVVLMGTFINLPTSRRIAAIGAQMQAADGSPSAESQLEMQRLQLRLKRASETAAVLLILATISMSIARYF